MTATLPTPQLSYFIEAGKGPPLLLVHGVMICGDMFQPVVEQLSTRYRLIIPDLRGHGRSRGLPPPFTPGQLAADLARLLDHLGIESTAVLGYSQGGAIAQQFALDYPSRCERLVLACTYAYNLASLREKIEGHIAPLLIRLLGMRRFARLVISQGLKQVSPPRRQWVTSLIADQDAKLMTAAWREVIGFDSRRRLSEIACPTLIVAGTDDQAVPMHHARMLHEGISNSRLVAIEGADHALIWARPDDLVQLVSAFMAGDERA